MAQEIYHRSEWGNPTETWGNTYLNADLTNELYKRASEYENSWVTDQLLNGVGTKPSIILTPTAYEDGILNSVKPAKTFGSELVTNGDYEQSGIGNAISQSGGVLVNENNQLKISSDGSSGYSRGAWATGGLEGNTFLIEADVISISGSVRFYDQSNNFSYTDLVAGSRYKRYIVLGSSVKNLGFGGMNDVNFELVLDNVSVKEVTEADFDFTRGSSATRVNEQGFVEDVQILSGELVQNGDFEQIGSELVTNGGFDTDSGWSFYNADADTNTRFENNSAILEVINAQFTRFISTTSPMTIGKFYKVTYEVTETDDTDLNIQYPNTSLNSSLGTHSVYIKSTNANIGFSKVGVGKIIIDNVSVKEVGQNWTFGTGWSMGDGVVSANAPTGNLDQSLTATSGSKYRVTFTISNYVSGDIRWRFTGTSNENGTLRSANGTYTEEITLTNSQSIFRFPATGGVMDIDNISVIEVTDDTDLPRINYTNFDYEDGEVVPYSGEGSLLLENQSTNLITYSEDFSQWVKYNSSVNTNLIQSPSGFLDADKIIENTNNSTHFVSPIVNNVPSSGIATLSVFAKKGENNWIKLVQYTNYANFDLENGVIGNSSAISSSIINYGNGWYKCIMNFNIAGSGANLDFKLGENNTSNWDDIYTGDGTSGVYLWGAQLEALSYATSYIPTNGSTVTRLADVCNNSGNSDLINSTEGVLYAEISALANDGTYRLMSISDGTATNRITLGYSNGSNLLLVQVRSSGVSQVNFTYSISNITSYNKIALLYKSNEVTIWVNGVKGTSDTSASMPIGLSEFNFNYTNSLPFYGNVKCVAVFKEALSDTELQKLTTI